MATASRPLRIAFLHPDLGIGGAERLVVDAALGLQALGHSIDIYTSHWDPNHCFEETKDGSLKVHYIKPPLPRSFGGKFHILCAHARQLHLITRLLTPWAPKYDVYFVDQLSTCVPFLRNVGSTRVVFYCHFPDKLLANGAFIDGNLVKKQGSLLKRIYRYPMDWLEEATTRQADVILANSKFTARVFKSYFPSISQTPGVVYPGINIQAYASQVDNSDPEISRISSGRPTLLSLNRFERKKNAALAIEAFAIVKSRLSTKDVRLVLAGGYDPRLQDNIQTLGSLIELTEAHSLTYNIETPAVSTVPVPQHLKQDEPDILFLLNFTTAQRTALLNSPSTKALLYTPANEHFGIGPVEAMICGVPILACDSGGPTESIVDTPSDVRTGWLRPPDPVVWADMLQEILALPPHDREALSVRGKERARELFSLDAMSKGLEKALVMAVSLGDVDNFGFKILASMVAFVIAYVSTLLVFPSS
ncbi:glycosyltransferase family 4 protein [Macrolepiota fuliginosa MF-IS2]|uniref:Alpha-1,3/1,6-mannosyltransferase ALG2 n=1 Tax=Macrolepiota fuliginosa MF-IS2 TaxID=1400762 RepID=A0A9P5XMP9_9AGAR|nr:glycosyltransferase family 4 protein [Macrolepiota fuliginosa MF-IS2]